LVPIPVSIVTSAFNTIFVNNQFSQTVTYPINKGFSLGMSDYLLDGDGDLKITITYKIKNV